MTPQEIKALWIAHGGSQHGPMVETYTIPESRFYAFVQALMGGPVAMILTCPICTERHIDEGEFAEKPHHTHACQGCGFVWRPAKENTVGVQFLPGYRNGDPK